MDEAMDVAWVESVKSSLCHRASPDRDRYGKACHWQHCRHQSNTSEEQPRTLAH